MCPNATIKFDMFRPAHLDLELETPILTKIHVGFDLIQALDGHCLKSTPHITTHNTTSLI